MTLAERFGANLRRCRRRAGLSQDAAAIRASLHRTEISYLERGLREPRLKTLVKVCGAVEAEPNELLEGIEWLPGSEVRGRFDVPETDATL